MRPAYKPDKTTNYELGVHSQFGDSLRLNGSVFYIEWDDVQLDSVTQNGDIPIHRLMAARRKAPALSYRPSTSSCQTFRSVARLPGLMPS